MNSKALREKRQQLVHEMRALHKDNEEWNEDLQKRWEEYSGKLDEIDRDLDRARKIETLTDSSDPHQEERDRQRFQDLKKSTNPSDEDPSRPLNGYEESLALKTWFLRGRGPFTTERGMECCRRAGLDLSVPVLELPWIRGCDEDGTMFGAPRTIKEARSQSVMRREHPEYRAQSLTTTAGGFTVPDEMMRPLEIALLQFGGMRQVAEIISTATGAPLPIPTTNDTANVGEIIAENTTYNEQDVTFGQLVLDAYKYSSKFIRVSIELMQDSATNLPALLGRLLGERIGRITNTHFTTGTGTAQPRGIVTAAVDSGVTTASATAYTYAEILGLKHSVDPAYRTNGTWMFADATLLIIKKIADSTGRPLWLPSYVSGEPATIDGDPYVINQSMPVGAAAKTMIYGDLSNYKIRDVLGVTIQRLDERYAELGQVAFLGFARFDGDLVNAGTGPVKFLDSP